MTRRGLLWPAAAAGGLAAIFRFTGQAQSRSSGGVRYGPINKYSAPSDLKITDIRACRVAANFDYPIVKLYTNQDVYGLGEVRDAGLESSALVFKPLLVGRNPLDISGILRTLRPYAGAGRQGGGYSAIDIALHDITGKVFGVPVWRLVGDKKRDRIRMYCDTTGTGDAKLYGERMAKRKALGFTFFKMDVTANFVSGHPGALNDYGIMTEKGLGYACELIAAVRDAIGWEAPLSVDASSGMRRRPGGPEYLPTKDAIRTARAYEKFELAWLEDLFSTGGWWKWQDYKEVKAATATKILTCEDAFGLEEGFQPLIDNRAVDVIHPDPGTSGACRETKRIADYAYQRAGIRTAIHMAGSPLATLAACHCAATLDAFESMECHAIDFLSWWQQLVTGIEQPIIRDGHIAVPDVPGIGIELNEPVVKEHLRYPGYFEPTPMYDQPLGVGRGRGGPWPHFDVEGKWVDKATRDY
jgi:L-alanine-DL-glutamate epimerase-like enolase superfamily enzyme